MAKKNEFDFNESMDDFSLESEPMPEDGSGGKIKGGKRPVSRQILLLVLLLVVGAAAAFFLLGPSEPEAPAPAPAPAKRQPIAVPVKPAPQPVTAQPANTTQPVPASAPQPVVPKPAPAPRPVAAKPAPVAQPVAAKPAPVPTAVAQQVPAPSAASLDNFFLAGGAFLYKGNLEKAEKLVRQLGFEPRVASVLRPVKMTRLRVGIFPPVEAKAKVKELSVKYPGAFSIKKGDLMAVYVGSYHDLDLGRFYADKLYLEGIHLDEEVVNVEMPVRVLTFGDFSDRAAAETTAAKAKALGLTAEVHKQK